MSKVLLMLRSWFVFYLFDMLIDGIDRMNLWWEILKCGLWGKEVNG